MILKSVSPYFANDVALLSRFGAEESLWEDDVTQVIEAYARDLYTDDAIAAIQKARRLIRIFVAGLHNNEVFKKELAATPLQDWGQFSEPPAPRALQDALADKLFIVDDTHRTPILEIGDQARYIGTVLFDRCVAEKLTFDVNIYDENFAAVLFKHADDLALQALAAHFLMTRSDITARIFVQHNLPEGVVIEADVAKMRTYRDLLRPWRDRVVSGAMRTVLTSIPTRRDAEVDGIPHKEYAELYFRMCDQPWDLIKTAQYALIEKLNAGKVLRFTNIDGTDLTMNIDGFTFCNSVIARNIPGSEVFSAPRIDSTNGIIVAKGRFSAKEDAGSIIENITLVFKDGTLTSARAERGQEHLDKALSVDAGAKRIGEIGIGTNPFLKRHVASILLSEKIGGSFHVALGDAYTMTDYMGDPVVVDNGNRSLLHWDITTMLYGKKGQIILDGVPIMVDGIFLDPALDVLNRGWQAVPFDQRPPAWQEIYKDR